MGNVNNIQIEPCLVYWGGEDLGFTDGDIEVSPEEQAVDITAHQEGTNLLDAFRTGNNLSLSVTLKETTLAKITDILTAGGAEAVPQPEITSITCVADVASSLNNKYFFINTAVDALQHYVWFNVDSAGVDPAPAGKTGVAVAIAEDATATQVATAVAAALDALPGYVATSSGAVVTVTNAANGSTTDAVDVNAGFTIAVTQQGVGALVGWGKTKNFLSMLADSQQLTLHPSRLPLTDKTNDFNVWKAYPMLNSIVHSGENPKLVTVEFRCFHDATRPEEIDLFAIGDGR